MRSQVTTKRGDGGDSVTISGDTVRKSHPILECCGRLDTLRAATASCRLALLDSGRGDAEEIGEFLFWLLHVYFLVGAQCNDPLNKKPEYRKGDVSPVHLEHLERVQEEIEEKATLPKKFVVSASNGLSAQFDVLCTQVRDLERGVVTLKDAVPEFQHEHIVAFVNRLSDCIFMIARHLDDGKYTIVDYDVLDEAGEEQA